MPEQHTHVHTNQSDLGDPTETTMLRKNWGSEFYKRFNALRGAVRTSVIKNDALGIGEGEAKPGLFNKNDADLQFNQKSFGIEPLGRFELVGEPEKHRQFMSWLNEQTQKGVLGIEPGASIQTAENRWTDTWVRRGYSKGVRKAEVRLRKAGIDTGQTQPVNVTLNQPIHSSKLSMLFSRTFEELDGITKEMSRQVSRNLADGLSQGWNPRKTARQINDRIDKIGITRGRMIARTETIRAHSEASLNRYEQFGVNEVGGKAEWLTAGDKRVCPRCAGLAGTVYTIDSARGLIPIHTNCRCTWIPITPASKKSDTQAL